MSCTDLVDSQRAVEFISGILNVRGPTSLLKIYNYTQMSPFHSEIGSSIYQLNSFLSRHPLRFQIKEEMLNILGFGNDVPNKTVIVNTVYPVTKRLSQTRIAERFSLICVQEAAMGSLSASDSYTSVEIPERLTFRQESITTLKNVLSETGPLPACSLYKYLETVNTAIFKAMGNNLEEFVQFLNDDDNFLVEGTDQLIVHEQIHPVTDGTNVEASGSEDLSLLDTCTSVEKSQMFTYRQEGIIILKNVLSESGQLTVKSLYEYLNKVDQVVCDAIVKNYDEFVQFLNNDVNFLVEGTDVLTVRAHFQPITAEKTPVASDSKVLGSQLLESTSTHSEVVPHMGSDCVKCEIYSKNTFNQILVEDHGVNILKSVLTRYGPLPCKNLIGYLSNSSATVRQAVGRNSTELLTFLNESEHFIVEGSANEVRINNNYFELIPHYASECAKCTEFYTNTFDQKLVEDHGVNILKGVLTRYGPLPCKNLIGYLSNSSAAVRKAVGKNDTALLLFLTENEHFIVEGSNQNVHINKEKLKNNKNPTKIEVSSSKVQTSDERKTIENNLLFQGAPSDETSICINNSISDVLSSDLSMACTNNKIIQEALSDESLTCANTAAPEVHPTNVTNLRSFEDGDEKSIDSCRWQVTALPQKTDINKIITNNTTQCSSFDLENKSFEISNKSEISVTVPDGEILNLTCSNDATKLFQIKDIGSQVTSTTKLCKSSMACAAKSRGQFLDIVSTTIVDLLPTENEYSLPNEVTPVESETTILNDEVCDTKVSPENNLFNVHETTSSPSAVLERYIFLPLSNLSDDNKCFRLNHSKDYINPINFAGNMPEKSRFEKKFNQSGIIPNSCVSQVTKSSTSEASGLLDSNEGLEVQVPQEQLSGEINSQTPRSGSATCIKSSYLMQVPKGPEFLGSNESMASVTHSIESSTKKIAKQIGIEFFKNILLKSGPLPIRRLVGHLDRMDKTVRDVVGKNQQQLLQFLLADNNFTVHGADDIVSDNEFCTNESSKLAESISKASVSNLHSAFLPVRLSPDNLICSELLSCCMLSPKEGSEMSKSKYDEVKACNNSYGISSSDDRPNVIDRRSLSFVNGTSQTEYKLNKAGLKTRIPDQQIDFVATGLKPAIHDHINCFLATSGIKPHITNEYNCRVSEAFEPNISDKDSVISKETPAKLKKKKVPTATLR